MPIVNIRPKIKATDRYKAFLQISSLFLTTPLTRMEIDILDELYSSHGGDLTTEARRQIREALDLSPELVNNYVRSLRKKKVITGDQINPQLMIHLSDEPVFEIHVGLTIYN